MRVFNSWLTVLTKNTIKNKAFLALMLLIPVLCFTLGQIVFGASGDEVPVILLYAEREDDFTTAVMEDLLGESDGYIFEEASSEEEVENSVRDHTALCGYVMKKNQLERILDGKTRGNVISVERTGNIKSDIVREIFFSAYYKEYTRFYTPYYLDLSDEDTEAFVSNYDDLMNSSVFNYSIEELESDSEPNEKTPYGRNLVGIMLCLFVMLLIVDFIDDKNSGILYPVKPSLRVLFRLLYFVIPVFMLLPFSLLGVILEGVRTEIIHELVSLVLYAFMLSILGTLFSYVITKRHIIIGVIPVITILFIIVCPTFLDLSMFVPVIKVLRYLCPPYYYMAF